MITAIDTNLLLDVLIPNERLFASSLGAIETAAAEGSLVICDLVYAELCIHFSTQQECDEFLEANDIRVTVEDHEHGVRVPHPPVLMPGEVQGMDLGHDEVAGPVLAEAEVPDAPVDHHQATML